MNFSAPDLLSISQSFGWLYQIFNILDTSIEPNERWRNLQYWLDQNPSRRKWVEQAATVLPDEAMTMIFEATQFDEERLRILDPFGFVKSKAQTGIARLQQLYRERKEMDQIFDPADGRRIDSPGKKRKKRAIKNNGGKI